MHHRSPRTTQVLSQATRPCIEPLDQRILFATAILVTGLFDADASGTKTTGDQPLEGWEVYLDSNLNGAHDSAEPILALDKDGEAKFSVSPGNYRVREIIPSGWAPTPGTPDFYDVNVIQGETPEVFFYNVASSGSTVEGIVWNDLNGDGVHDLTDPGLEGWTVFLDLNTDQVLDAGEPFAVTDPTGYYAITDVAPGQYRVREIVEAGWDTTIGTDAANAIDVLPGANVTQDFGNINVGALGTLDGTVWNDVNADGVRALTDPGLSGWTVFIDSNANSTLDVGERSAITDALGFYSFASVLEGTYQVVEVLQPGWNVSPGYAVSQSVTVVGDNETIRDFANYTPTLGSVSGKVWNDANANGFIDGGESGINGWTVYVDADSDGALTAGEPSATTNASGDYTITDVSIGSALVREVPGIGWKPTAPGTGMQLVTVLNGSNVANVNFGNQQQTDSSIRGAVYFDANKNGVRDAGERGLSGITVYLDANDNGALDAGEASYVTLADLFYTPAVNETGTFEFTHLGGGTYHVREITPIEQSATPLGSRHLLINLLPGEDRANINFGNVFRPNEIHGVAYKDTNGNHVRDAGEAGLKGVTIYLDLDRDNVMDPLEPRTRTASDGSYGFVESIAPDSYVIREITPWAYTRTYPTTTGGTLWPPGVSNPAVGIVDPTSITVSLAKGEKHTQNVSLTLPGTGALTDKADVFLLFDDTGSFTGNSPIVRAAFPQIISSLQTALPGLDMGFGVGRLEEYANFASEFSSGRPFVLNQPVVSQSTPNFATAIQNALNRMAPGYGGDTPETDIEALFQLVTGKGFDGNDNGSLLDSGPAGPASTQLTPGASGDVPPFASFTPDPANMVLAPSGNLGGGGFRAGALPIILLATDTGFAYQPKGETSITGVGGLTLPLSALTQSSRATTPFNAGAGIQETITALNSLGALVIGLGTNPGATLAPRSSLEAIAKLTGAVNQTTTTIANGTADPIAPGDPLYFQIASGFSASVVNGVIAAIQNAVTNVAVNITLKSSDPTVLLTHNPGVVNNVSAGQTASFSVEFTGDGRPHRFDLQFVRQGTDVVLGSIPVVLGTPIPGDGYDYEDLEDGEIDDHVDFGNYPDPSPAAVTVSSQFDYETQHAVLLDFNFDVEPELDLGDIVVTESATGNPVTVQSLTFDYTTNRATALFQPLADGNYHMTLGAGTLPTLGTAHQLDFFVLAGDADRNRKVDTRDFNMLAGNFGASGRTFSQGDFSYNGTVDSVDFDILAGQYGKSLPAASSTTMRVGTASGANSTPASAPLFSKSLVDGDTLIELV
jgi:hypothetical protein